MKLVKENICEKFIKDSDPISDMGIGMTKIIKQWIADFEKIRGMDYIKNPVINEGLIDADRVDISWSEIDTLPSYIHFGIIKGNFSCSFGQKNLLPQLPKKVYGQLSIFPGKSFNNDCTKEDVLEYCEVDIDKIFLYAYNKQGNSIELKENLYEKFIEDSDPIHDLGIGINIERNFNTTKQAASFIIKFIPYILHTDEIPKDIIDDPTGHLLKADYLPIFNEYLAKYILIKNKHMTISQRWDIYASMLQTFKNKGYKRK